jgi:hypothetical protein
LGADEAFSKTRFQIHFRRRLVASKSWKIIFGLFQSRGDKSKSGFQDLSADVGVSEGWLEE